MDSALPISPLDPRQGNVKQEHARELQSVHSSGEADYQVGSSLALLRIWMLGFEQTFCHTSIQQACVHSLLHRPFCCLRCLLLPSALPLLLFTPPFLPFALPLLLLANHTYSLCILGVDAGVTRALCLQTPGHRHDLHRQLQPTADRPQQQLHGTRPSQEPA